MIWGFDTWALGVFGGWALMCLILWLLVKVYF